MCFGGGSKSTPQPPPPTPGIINTDKPAPDYSQASKYQGRTAPENMTGRVGGPLLVEQQAKKALGE